MSTTSHEEYGYVHNSAGHPDGQRSGQVMSDTMVITTNHNWRPIVDAYELTPIEREEFDYLDWTAIEAGEDSASFFRYRGELYDLGEFQTTHGLHAFSELCKWDGYIADSYFSGIVVRYAPDHEYLMVGSCYS